MSAETIFYILGSTFMVMGIIFLLTVIGLILYVAIKARQITHSAQDKMTVVSNLLSESNIKKVSFLTMAIPIVTTIFKAIHDSKKNKKA